MAALTSTELDALFEMANLFPKHTGLPFVVWISSSAGVQHDIRVKVACGAKVHPSEMTSVAIRPNVHVVGGTMDSRDLELLRQWIELNRGTIVSYWNGEIDTVDAIQALRKLAS